MDGLHLTGDVIIMEICHASDVCSLKNNSCISHDLAPSPLSPCLTPVGFGGYDFNARGREREPCPCSAHIEVKGRWVHINFALPASSD